MTTLNESNRRNNQSPSGQVRSNFGDSGEQLLGSGAVGRAQRRQDALRSTIVLEIIPRLMLLNGICSTTRQCDAKGECLVRVSDIEKLTELLLAGEDAGVSELVNAVMNGGVSQSSILLDLFAPAARRLGELWETDTHTFAEVTFAMGGLQESIRRLQSEWLRLGSASHTPGHSIMLAPGSGEQHWFAIQVLDNFFSRAGWRVVAYPSFDSRFIGKSLAAQHIDILGLSISREALLDQLSSDIDNFRAKSRNKSLRVLVGGRVFTGRHDLAKSVGADGSADDATAAVVLANQFVSHAVRVGI